jgi:glyoxylase-like metal-dependent hydrolase (beta-lactamase superfamily II)
VPLDLTVPDSVKQAALPPVKVESQKLAEGVWWLGGGTHHSVLVEYPTYLTMIEAPLNEERSLAVIAEAKKLVPNKPIKYLVNTHQHFDHSGGIRTYIAEGATVITNAMYKPFYEQAYKAPRTLAPDKLSQNPKKAAFVTVKDKYVLADGGRSIEILHVENDNHNEGILMVYFPKEKILVEADDYTPIPPNGPPPAPRAVAFTNNLYANIERLKLDVATVAPLHGFVVPFAQLQKAAGKS